MWNKQASPVFLKVWSISVNNADSKVPPHTAAGETDVQFGLWKHLLLLDNSPGRGAWNFHFTSFPHNSCSLKMKMTCKALLTLRFFDFIK